MSFEGRGAIVTGVGSGIGQALALHLLREAPGSRGSTSTIAAWTLPARPAARGW